MVDKIANQNGDIIAPGAFAGAMPIRDDITILPRDDPKGLRLGWTIRETVGKAVINSEAVDRIFNEEETIRKLGEYMRKYAR